MARAANTGGNSFVCQLELGELRNLLRGSGLDKTLERLPFIGIPSIQNIFIILPDFPFRQPGGWRNTAYMRIQPYLHKQSSTQAAMCDKITALL